MADAAATNSSTPVWQIDAPTAQSLVVQQAYGLFNTTWLGILATVAIALVLLSTPQQRRGPVFTLQCVAFPMALTNALLVTVCVVLNAKSLFTSKNMTDTLVPIECAQKAFEAFTPLVCDATLIFKVLAFYPVSPIPSPSGKRGILRQRWIPVAPLLVIGLARTVTCTLVTYFYYQYDYLAANTPPEITAAKGRVYHRSAMAEFILQIIYCSYASALLFRKIYLFAQRRRMRKRRGTALLQRRLRYLIESLAMTFILPVIAQIIAAVAAQLGKGVVLYIASLTNVYLSTLLSVLATSWSTIRLHRVHHSRDSTFFLSRPSSGGSGGADAHGSPEKGSPKSTPLNGLPNSSVKEELMNPSSHGQVQFDNVYQPQNTKKLGGLSFGLPRALKSVYGGEAGRQPVQQVVVVSNDQEAEELGNIHRETLLASLFDDEEEVVGQATSVEMLTTLPPVQSDAELAGQLPTRGTSGWRRGVLRSENL
ncbi:uncharacterized protein FA14DRAFT_160097 [Meira miltonrushii]|uniref:Uncharacterized protein n=1 Tax=Meira miltonrushii TaxID=1280837 RepID=A0A316VEV5_9BASI|nr:uncharacterized protein FA14DRAFT_160097 [Meira miltonrushii]PWN34531.1 hypothetical protein FA14DRAFT_160097 [Meira miltonrushii]